MRSKVVAVHAKILEQTSQQIFLLCGLLIIQVTEIALVLNRREHLGLDSIGVQVHAVLDSLVQDSLRIVGGIDILELKRLHPLVFVVESCIDHTVPNCFCHHLLGFFDALKTELMLNVGERDS